MTSTATSESDGIVPGPAHSSGRIFCVGFQKTGTCSMRDALKRLGIRVEGHRDDFIEAIRNEDVDTIDAIVEQFGAFQDNPWNVIYRLLDERYPGSRFILTVRDEDRWYQSILNHFGVFGEKLMRLVYGKRNPAGNEALYRARYRAHNEEVQAYFRDRPDDLLVMNLSAGDGWPELCGFLGVEVIEETFPHANERSYNSLVAWINKICTRVVVGCQAVMSGLGLGGRAATPPGSFYWRVEPRLDLPPPPPRS